MIIAVGSTRAAKVGAVRMTVARIAEIDPRWIEAEIISRDVATSAPAMPMSDEEMMLGARERTVELRRALSNEGIEPWLCVGLEGGFHTTTPSGAAQTFLRGWAYAADSVSGCFGCTPSIVVPERIVRRVIEESRELGELIDEYAGQHDVRSNQGAWGVLSRDLFTRSMSFETALIAALAPFYNPDFYQ